MKKAFSPLKFLLGEPGNLYKPADWLAKFNGDSDFKCIALKVFMILPIILLQKPSATSKAKDHSDALLRQIDWFNDGNIEGLIVECRDIQCRLRPERHITNFLESNDGRKDSCCLEISK